MSQINELGLRWFQSHAGRIVTWKELKSGPCLLVTTAKGIFKPKDQEYVLSVRQTLDSPYHDEEPIYQDDGSWAYLYAQEGDDSDPEHRFTNRGLLACMRDDVPVGVIRQISKKPDVTRYEVLGLARVVSWNNGIFALQSTVLDYPSPPPSAILQAATPQEIFYGYDPALAEDARQKVQREITRRQGQKAFRSGLLTAYQSRCAITGCAIETVLEAAHITPYLGLQTNHVTNGLLLRSDIHTLWDSGNLFVDANFCVCTKPVLNNSEYEELNGKALVIPIRREIQPSSFAIDAHRNWCLGKASERS